MNVFLADSCLELYEPPTSRTDYGYLVVNGYLNNNDTTFINLSQTQTLAATARPSYVTGATVHIEDDQGGVNALVSSDTGTYYLTPRNWDVTLRYRIRIETNADEYISDFVPLTLTPPIDSVTWGLEPDGVRIFVNTHDPSSQMGITFLGYQVGPPECVDCRYHGGKTVKPVFWGD